MKKTLLLLGSSIACHSFAGSAGTNSGSAVTFGPSLNHYSIYSASQNPAMAPLMVPDEERWRVTYFAGGGLNVELGDVENFVDDIDDLVDILEDPDSTTDDPDDVVDRFNDVLVRLGDTGYIKNSISVHVPVMPLYYRSEEFDGTFGMDISINTQVAALILDEELSVSIRDGSFNTNTSMYMKSGIETRFSFTYGSKYFEDSAISSLGDFYAGVKLNVIQLDLSKQVKRLEDFDGDEIEDIIREDYDQYLNSSWGVGLDFGIMWDADWYRLGLNFDNINSPSFEYGELGVNCNSFSDAIAQNSCLTARHFIDEGRIKGKEEHTMHARVRTDALLKISDRWFVTTSIDLAKYDDIVGFENQWFHIATAYETSGWWLPAPRIGYQKNLAGTELASVNLGFTFFKSVSLDVEYGLDSIEIDGTSGPRRFGLSIGFEEKF